MMTMREWTRTGSGSPAVIPVRFLAGSVEVLCGALVIVGLVTRLAAIPLPTIIVGPGSWSIDGLWSGRR